MRLLKLLALPLLLPSIAMMCLGHYRNHTSGWMEFRGYKSHLEIIFRILGGVNQWINE